MECPVGVDHRGAGGKHFIVGVTVPVLVFYASVGALHQHLTHEAFHSSAGGSFIQIGILIR